MKRYKNQYITNIIAFSLMVGGLMACQDEIFYDNDHQTTYDSNQVLFDAFIGAPVKNTRTGEDPFELEPLVLEGDGKKLYLHTYVCDNSFDPVEMQTQPTTRGLQVNDMASFREVHGDVFGIETRYADKFPTKYIETNNTSSPIVNTNEETTEVWKIDGRKVYWPANDAMLSFHAWAPVDLTKTGLNTSSFTKERGKMSFSYTAQKSEDGKNDAISQVDLLLAMTEASKQRPTKTNKGRAKLQFTHPLAAVKFAVRDVLGGTVKSITLKNIASKGDCVYTISKDGDYFTDTEPGSYTWTPSDPTTFTQEFYVDVPTLKYDDKGNMIIEDGRDDDGDYSITDKKSGTTFMMIPQDISADAEIEIVMTQTQFPEKGDVILSGKILDNGVKRWEAGKEYVYTISTSSENWTYVFNVTGSNQSPDGGFIEDPDSIAVNYSVTDGAYYHVTSYRYRANNPNDRTEVSWTGTVQDTEGKNLAYGVNVSDNKKIQDLIEKYGKLIPTDDNGIQMTYTPQEWFPNENFTIDASGDKSNDTFGEKGSTDKDPVKYNLKFKSQYIATDYEGDWEMRATAPEDNNDKDHPIDLSKRNGGLNIRNTANCYIVNKTGWYAIPLYYGNTVTRGDDTSKLPYQYIRQSGDELEAYQEHNYNALLNFVDYKGKPITQPKIVGAQDASLVWADAEGIISKDSVFLKKDPLELDPGEYIIFKIERDFLVQSNAVVAILDNVVDKNSETPITNQANIIWSWHIWVSDYWIDNQLVIGNHPKAEKNQVVCATMADELHGAPLKDSFIAAPRNLGWCDAKNVGYLKREGKIKFVQEGRPNKQNYEEEDYSHTLNVLQRGHLIEYWIGNNTYYQWGRKDPMVGFKNDENDVKDNYGPLQYNVADAGEGSEIGIDQSIKNPHLLYVRKNENSGTWTAPIATSNDWLSRNLNYFNLWNNYRAPENTTLTREKNNQNSFNGRDNEGVDGWNEPSQMDREGNYNNSLTPKHNTPFAYSAVKTVYDPSPAGFVVPPTTFFNVFVSGRVRGDYTNHGTPLTSFKGSLEEMKDGNGQNKAKFYIWKATTNSETPLVLTPTGQRWDKKTHSTGGWPPGGNMNPHIIYLWTNATTFDESAMTANGRTAFAFAIGDDGHTSPEPGPYVMTTHFNARKSMARPVRCVKEYENNF